MSVHYPDCPNRDGPPPDASVEYRVNITEDRHQGDPWFLTVCCRADAERLTKHARAWPNGEPRRWVESRQVGDWTASDLHPSPRVCGEEAGSHE